MKKIYINLPVADLEKSKIFYLKLGFIEYPIFTSKHQVCLCWSDDILVMLQSKIFFLKHSDKKLSDSKNFIASTFTLPLESFEIVNNLSQIALNAGGKEPNPMIDEGFLKVRIIEDLDGHSWGFMYLEIEKFIIIVNNLM